MDFVINPLTEAECKYTYAQSTQIEGQTGCIGHLRGDFGSGGNEFFTSWFDHRRDLKTDQFKNELDEVINALRSEEYGLLKSRTDMSQRKVVRTALLKAVTPPSMDSVLIQKSMLS